MSERENASAKKVECLTKEEELLFEVIQMAIEDGELNFEYKYLYDNEKFVEKFGIFFEILKYEVMNALDENAQVFFARKFYHMGSDALEDYASNSEVEGLDFLECALKFYIKQIGVVDSILGLFIEGCDIYDIINQAFVKMRENELD